MGKVFVLLALILVALAVRGFETQSRNQNALNVWTARCNRDGGLVETIRYGFATNDLECFRNGKIIDHEN